MLHVATDGSSGKVDVAILLVMNKLSFERTRKHSSLTQLLKAFPLKVAAVHIVRQPARLGVRLFDEMVVPTLKPMFRTLNTPIHAHSGTPNCDLLNDLTRYDFETENLPRSIGGGWTYQDYSHWREQRLIAEETSSTQLNLKTSLFVKSELTQNGDQNGDSVLFPMPPRGPMPQAQLAAMLNTAQAGPGCIPQTALADQTIHLTRKTFDPNHRSQITDQTMMQQLLELNRLQQVGSGASLDVSMVNWLEGRAHYLAENGQPQRSVAETASEIGSGSTLRTQLWRNSLIDSGRGPRATSALLEQRDPLQYLGAAFSPALISKQNLQQQREHGAALNPSQGALYSNLFSST